MVSGVAKRLAKKGLRGLGYDIVRIGGSSPASAASPYPPDLPPEDIETFRMVQPYTMTGPEAVHAVCEAVRYIVRHDIPGAVVECGVWRGGSMMAAARTLLRQGATDRDLFLFDTFEGMSPPSAEDVDFRGVAAADQLAASDRERSREPSKLVPEEVVWAYSPLETTRAAMLSVGYPEGKIHFVQGRVEDTLPARAPGSIALLRLDTDWYESTRHELVHLFPRLSPGGILIIDDYGHWKGARKATDEYLMQHKIRLFLGRINYTARIAVKQ